MKVYIDPRCRVNYASYYILGLFSNYGKEHVKFEIRHFSAIQPFNSRYTQENGMCFMLVDDKDKPGRSAIFYIDFEVYNCVDVYAKVNLNPAFDRVKYPKVMATGPSFAVDIWSLFDTAYYAIKHLFITRRHLSTSKLQFLKDY